MPTILFRFMQAVVPVEMLFVVFMGCSALSAASELEREQVGVYSAIINDYADSTNRPVLVHDQAGDVQIPLNYRRVNEFYGTIPFDDNGLFPTKEGFSTQTVPIRYFNCDVSVRALHLPRFDSLAQEPAKFPSDLDAQFAIRFTLPAIYQDGTTAQVRAAILYPVGSTTTQFVNSFVLYKAAAGHWQIISRRTSGGYGPGNQVRLPIAERQMKRRYTELLSWLPKDQREKLELAQSAWLAYRAEVMLAPAYGTAGEHEIARDSPELGLTLCRVDELSRMRIELERNAGRKRLPTYIRALNELDYSEENPEKICDFAIMGVNLKNNEVSCAIPLTDTKERSLQFYETNSPERLQKDSAGTPWKWSSSTNDVITIKRLAPPHNACWYTMTIDTPETRGNYAAALLQETTSGLLALRFIAFSDDPGFFGVDIVDPEFPQADSEEGISDEFEQVKELKTRSHTSINLKTRYWGSGAYREYFPILLGQNRAYLLASHPAITEAISNKLGSGWKTAINSGSYSPVENKISIHPTRKGSNGQTEVCTLEVYLSGNEEHRLKNACLVSLEKERLTAAESWLTSVFSPQWVSYLPELSAEAKMRLEHSHVAWRKFRDLHADCYSLDPEDPARQDALMEVTLRRSNLFYPEFPHEQ